MISNVTLNCSLLRRFSLLRFFQVLYEKHLPYLALREPSSEKQPFPYEDSSAFRGDIGFVCSLTARDRTTREIAAVLA